MKPTAFHDLPAHAFPVTIEFFTQDGTVVHRIEITGPGAVEIPALRLLHAGPIASRVIYASGQAASTYPDDWEGPQ